jgi:hypothetical protein
MLNLVREGYWNTLEAVCTDYYKRTSDPVYMFWRGFAQYNLGNSSAAINDLLSIQQKKEITYACIVALLYYQGKARNTDRVLPTPLRSKSTTSAPGKDSNAVTLLTAPSPKQSTSSSSSESHARLQIS